MKKDVLFLCQFFYPEHNSSATLPFDTARHFVQQGYSVDALCGYPKEYSDEKNIPYHECKDGMNIQRIRYIQLNRKKKIGRLINYFSFTISAFLRVFKLREYKSVIVYSNPPILPLVAVIANILFGTKIVFIAYDIYPEVAFASGSLQPGSLIDRGMRWINHLMYKRVSTVVALTEEMKEFLVQNRTEIDEQRITVIANWAHENEREFSNGVYQRLGYCKEQFIVSYFGNMGICQEMDTLVEAIEHLKDEESIQFLFAGHGSKMEVISRRFEEKQLKNVQMLGFLTGKEFEETMAISSCCVVSLEKGLKGMCAPSKYYSYLQGGHPVLGIIERGSYLEDEIEKERIGYAVEIGDSKRLAEIVLELSKNRENCSEMGRRAQALYCREYDRVIGLRKYAEMMRRVL